MLRVKAETRDALRVMAKETGSSMQRVAEEAVEAYRRQKILEETHAAYARLVQDEPVRAELEAERADWDVTLCDGMVSE